MSTELSALCEALDDAVVIADAAGHVLSWNHAASALFGYLSEEVLGRSVSQLLTGDELMLVDMIGAPEQSRHVTELLAARKDGTVFQCELRSTPFSATGAVPGARQWVLVLRDSAQRTRAELLLQRSEDKYRALAVNAPVGIFESDAEGKCVFVNRRWTEIVGRTFEEALGRGWTQAIHADDTAEVAAAVEAAGAAGASFSVDYRCVWKSGEVVWVHAAAVPLRDEAGRTNGYMGTVVDVTERRRTLEALAQSETNFRSLVERAPFGVTVTRAGAIVYANRTFLELTGYGELSQLRGLRTLDALFHPDARELVQHRERRRAAGEELPPATIHCLRRDGSEYFVETASSLIDFDGHPSHVFAVRDVTDRERAEAVRLAADKAMRESLREKEVLLKEVHHRVKNNLQVIVSLINLQAQKIEDPALRSVFEETRSRVHAIALLHERLYGSKNLGRIDMRDYLAGLASDLSSTNFGARPIRLTVEAEDLYFEMDAAVPIGLIVNELVTNAYKHAFPRTRPGSGEIRVELRREAAEIAIVVSDDGVGYPGQLDPDTADTLGLLLITSLSGQLEGHATFHLQSQGARCEVRFPDRTSAL
jgi:PAS domain S-box-containing protein